MCRYLAAALQNINVGIDMSMIAALEDMFLPERSQSLEVCKYSTLNT